MLFSSLQGIESVILASQPFLLITKPLEENRTRLPQLLPNVFLLLLLCQFWGKDTEETASVPGKNKCLTFTSPFPAEKQQHRGSASVLQSHWGMYYCLTAPALQSPCSQTPGLIYMYFHISFLYVTAALVWQQVTKGYRFYYGHRSGATIQNKASSHELPMICIAEVTFYPGCAIAVI